MKVCSIFSQVLKLFSRGEFEKAVKEHKAERHARGFTTESSECPIYAEWDGRRPIFRGCSRYTGSRRDQCDSH
jgi:Domain of unknown function (DUF4372)